MQFMQATSRFGVGHLSDVHILHSCAYPTFGRFSSNINCHLDFAFHGRSRLRIARNNWHLRGTEEVEYLQELFISSQSKDVILDVFGPQLTNARLRHIHLSAKDSTEEVIIFLRWKIEAIMKNHHISWS
jgi:hypothetical protein